MQTLPTPYFYMREQDLEQDVSLLLDSLRANWGEGNFLCGYSVKTNSLPWLLQFMGRHGLRAEIVSATEYALAKRLGFSEDNMIYNGPVKTRDSFRAVLLGGGIVNLDSSEELIWMEELSSSFPKRSFEVGLRVNFDLEALCPGETMMGTVGGRFGFCLENGRLKQAIGRLHRLPNVRVAGLHLHNTSQTRTLHIYRTVAGQACRIAETYGLDLSYVDMGGGYYGGMPGKPTYADYFPEICDELKKTFDPARTTLIAEPGISLISRATSFVTSVLDIKEIRGRRYLVTDGSRTNVDPMMTRTWYLHHIEKGDDRERAVLENQIVSAFTCLEHDRLFEIQNGEALQPGDRIVYENVGGYTMCLNPLFIRYFPPVYVEKTDGSVFAAREQWGVDEFLQKCVYDEDVRSGGIS